MPKVSLLANSNRNNYHSSSMFTTVADLDFRLMCFTQALRKLYGDRALQLSSLTLYGRLKQVIDDINQ